MNNLNIGLSLPLSYLRGRYDLNSKIWYEMFGPVQECLGLLKKYGVNSIEINDLHSNPVISEIEPAIYNIIKNGFRLSIHIFLPNFKKQSELPAVFKEVFRVLKVEDCFHMDIPFILHGHNEDIFIDRKRVISRTITDLQILLKKIKRQGIKPFFVLELCRSKIRGPVGVNYQEVAGMIEKVSHDSIGICWDMGHTLYNIASQRWENIMPPTWFLNRVRHVHIHDLDCNKKTHGAVNGKNHTLNSFIKLLLDNEYQGIFNFELYPQRWEDSIPIRRKKVINSINVMRWQYG